MKFILVLLSLIFLRCCWGLSDYQLMYDLDSNYNRAKVLNGSYHIYELNMRDVSALDLKIAFEDSLKSINGYAGCNRFFGKFNLKENRISLNNLGSTKMLCDEKANSIEKELFEVFNDANILFFNETGISLFENKRLVLRATRRSLYQVKEIEYTASSRGFYQFVKMNSESTIVLKNRNQDTIKINTGEYNWQKIIGLIENIDLQNLPKLKAPTQNHQFDGAPLANLVVTTNKESFEAPTFDHGNPPVKISELVKEMLSIAENVE